MMHKQTEPKVSPKAENLLEMFMHSAVSYMTSSKKEEAERKEYFKSAQKALKMHIAKLEQNENNR